jgi:hypothetical protein
MTARRFGVPFSAGRWLDWININRSSRASIAQEFATRERI